MADGADESFGFLAHKAGPLPVWMWGALVIGGYYVGKNYFGLFGGTSASSTTATDTTSVDESGELPSQPVYGGSQYSSNAEWQGAAINYLVGESVPPDQASAAIWNYLHSKVLTSEEQRDVNLAIEGIGPPPTIPGPASVPPTQKPPTRKPHKKPPGHPTRPPRPRKPPVRKRK